MERSERVLAYISSKEYVPLKLEELMLVLGVPAEDKQVLEDILSEWILKGKIYKTKKGRYETLQSTGMVSGTLHCSMHGYFAFLIPEEESEEKIYIDGASLANALDKDKVLVSVDRPDSAHSSREGHVVRVLERGNTVISGVIKKMKNGYYQLRPDSQKIYANPLIAEQDLLGAQIGDRVLASLTKYENDKVYATVTKVLGDALTLKSNIDAIVFSAGIREEFDDKTIEEAEATPDSVSDAELSGRADFRNDLIITIDGEDARDFDDAVSVTVLENGNYLLGVHIADVTHYVTPGSSLDREAFERGTSVYLADRVIPMLPKKLSNGICSLNPHCDRLTLSVHMEINKNGDVLSHRLEKGVIHSCERMTYKNVALLLEGTDEALQKTYAHLLPMLSQMQELAACLNRKRMQRGSINFDFPESKIIVNEYGEPVNILPEQREISHKIIEEFMLIANETVAEYAFWSELPFVYRVHEPPALEKMQDFQRFIANFGLSIKGKIDIDSPVHPKALQQVLDSIAGRDEEHMISSYMLRSLMKAEYRPENLGHFGLSAKYYCHFTSPIRRYPDLAIHRVLKDFLDKKPTDGYRKFCDHTAAHSSETERTAELCERDVDDLMKAYYMSQYIGYVFDAKVSGVTSFGMFAELENSVEGFIRLDYLKDDYYLYDENRKMLTGERTGRTYKIGDAIEVAIVQCDLLSRQIDMIPAEGITLSDIEEIRQRSFRKKKEKERKIKKNVKAPHRYHKKSRKHK